MSGRIQCTDCQNATVKRCLCPTHKSLRRQITSFGGWRLAEYQAFPPPISVKSAATPPRNHSPHRHGPPRLSGFAHSSLSPFCLGITAVAGASTEGSSDGSKDRCTRCLRRPSSATAGCRGASSTIARIKECLSLGGPRCQNRVPPCRIHRRLPQSPPRWQMFRPMRRPVRQNVRSCLIRRAGAGGVL